MPKTRTSSALELLVPVSRDGSEPLHRQLEQELRDAVRTGRLGADMALPSTRALSAQLGLARGVVVEAYEQLIAEGYLRSRPGGATLVAHAAAAPTTDHAPRPAAARPEFDFRAGRPDVSEFPRQAWLRSVRRVLNEAPTDRFGYLDGRGMPELRAALASYLNRVRGTCAEPDDMVISTGFAQGLGLLCEVLAASGARRLAVEDPSDPDTRSMIRAIGLEIVGIPVDESGIRVDMLDAAKVNAVLVTSAHQYPTGAVLDPDRRAALVAWATHTNGLIVEDDYDAEFRYDREPIGAIQGLAPDRVVYGGSASKVLAPGLRLGWFLVPPALVDAVARAKKAADLGSSALDQLAFADFVSRGELDRHLRRMRPIYRRRRDALLAALRTQLPELRPIGASAGLHVLAWLPDDVDEAKVLTRATESGVAITGLTARRINSSGPGGLIFGYAAVPEDAMEKGVRRLAKAIAEVRDLEPAG